jgi:fructose-1-phosphate kinase PfkB-like protein
VIREEAVKLALTHARQAESCNTSVVRGSWDETVKPDIYRDLVREATLASMWSNVARVMK